MLQVSNKIQQRRFLINGKGHLLVGVSTTFFGVLSLNLLEVVQVEPVELGIAIIAAGLGSITPDIDHPSSIISKRLPKELFDIAETVTKTGAILSFGFLLSHMAVSGKQATWGMLQKAYHENSQFFFIAIFLVAFSLILLILSYTVRFYFGHRGPTHSYIIATAVTCILLFLGMLFGCPAGYIVAFGWGWLTHLVADSFTPRGLPYALWPLG